MRALDDRTDFEQFSYMYSNFERLENGEIHQVAEHMAEAFGIEKQRAHIKLTNYHYNRSMRRLIDVKEIDEQTVLVYKSNL